jgi:hypothetical protein
MQYLIMRYVAPGWVDSDGRFLSEDKVEAMNVLGEEGWELVCVTSPEWAHDVELYFRR